LVAATNRLAAIQVAMVLWRRPHPVLTAWRLPQRIETTGRMYVPVA
jgi:hypothetical protein